MNTLTLATAFGAIRRRVGTALLALIVIATVVVAVPRTARSAEPGDALYRINAGGPSIGATTPWEADTKSSPSVYANTGASGNFASSTSAAIDLSHPSIPPGTAPGLFQTERWDSPSGAELSYAIPMTVDDVFVRLYFAEAWNGGQAVGKRVFDVSIEGQLVLDDYDIYSEAGGYAGIVETFRVSTDSTLNIDFTRVVQNPSIRGIEVLTVMATGEPGELIATPASLMLPPAETGSVSTASIDIENPDVPGGFPVTIDSESITGAGSADYTTDFSGPLTLQPGQTTTVGVTFAPTTAGESVADLNFAIQGQPGPLVVSLQATGTSPSLPELVANPSALVFPGTPVGSIDSDMVTLRNDGTVGSADLTIESISVTGPNAGDFVHDFAVPVVLAPQATLDVEVQYQPTVVGSSAAQMEVTSSGTPSPLSIALDGTGLDPDASVVLYRVNAGGPAVADVGGAWEADTSGSPSPYNNSSLSGNFTSSTSAVIDLSHPSVPLGVPMEIMQKDRWDPSSGAELEWDFPVPPGDVEVRLYFSENWSGAFKVGGRVFDVFIDGALMVDDLDVYAEVGGNAALVRSFVVPSDGNLDIDLLRFKQNPSVKAIEVLQPQTSPGEIDTSPDQVDYPDVVVGDSSAQAVSISNLGGPSEPAIEISALNFTGPNAAAFSHAAALPITVAGGQTVQVDVTFAPTQGGQNQATLEVVHDGVNPTQTVQLQGNALLQPPPDAAVTPTSVSFVSTEVGDTSTATVTISSLAQPGEGDVTVSDVSADDAQITTDFSGPVILSPGQTIDVELTFAPVAEGVVNAGLLVTHDGPSSPLAVSLTGTGVAPPAPNGVLYRVNAGGPAIASSVPWEADTSSQPSQYLVPGSNSFVSQTSEVVDLSDPSVPVDTPMELFQTERWDSTGGDEMSYRFPVTPGLTEVRIYLAEIYAGASYPGGRVFDVVIEGAVAEEDIDVFSEVGANAGIMRSYSVQSDSNLDLTFLHQVQNPAVKGIEIIEVAPQPNTLAANPSSVGFVPQVIGTSSSTALQLTNLGASGDPDVTVTAVDVVGSHAGDFSTTFSGPIVIAPGQSASIDVGFAPSALGSRTASLSIQNSGTASPLDVALSGEGLAAQGGSLSFIKSQLNGESSTSPTSLQFGPDGRLYVARASGLIDVYSVERDVNGAYNVTVGETIDLVQQIPNHNDDGTDAPNSTRLLTGLLVSGTSNAPVIYAGSTDPRFGAGPSGSDTGLDTNSGIVSRLIHDGVAWQRTDLVRGLPRSEENHSLNGMVIDEAAGILYLAVGGNTNKGAPSNNFAHLPEYALSAAILSIDLNAIGDTTYDLPTLDDEDRVGTTDFNDPFGGNDGKNQAVLVPGGPVQVYSPGFRNAYDVVITEAGLMYSVDNGGNAGWGDVPVSEGPGGTCTNDVADNGDTDPDALINITGPGFYAGHPNPTRGNAANTFNPSNPQSPVSAANPVECDYLDASVDRPVITTFGNSTNGIAEYTASNFNGQLQGDLLMASFDNSIKRVKLDGTGTAAVLDENLFSNVGQTPLDVTTQGDADIFPGTIWVADYVSGSIVVYEPDDALACQGVDDPAFDEDGDGYTNADEIANGTNPCSSADVPPDADGDLVSDLLDSDDDNDGVDDQTDPFAVDPTDGLGTTLPVVLTWENDAPDEGGILGLGFTGLMSNGIDNYASLFDPQQMTAGGAAGVVTIDTVAAGTAAGTANDQQYGFQFGINAAAEITPFTVSGRIGAPFAGITPEDGQETGVMIGTGDQSNYASLVASGTGGGQIEFTIETGDALVTEVSTPLTLPGPAYIDLLLEIDPGASTIQPLYQVDGGPIIPLGTPQPLPPGWINPTSGLAVGLISTSPSGAPLLSASWDEIGVVTNSSTPTTHAAEMQITPSGSIDASTYATGSIRVWNRSTGGEKIAQVRLDLSTAAMPDMVFDPLGIAGDDAFKDLTFDGALGTLSFDGHTFVRPHDDGYDELIISLSGFDTGERATFSVDIDPTSIRGTVAPGPSDSGSVSGLEMAGATVTVVFDDGVTIVNELSGVPGQPSGSFARLDATVNAAPIVELVGVATPTVVNSAAQTVRVTGTPGEQVRLQVLEAALFVDASGGFDIDAFEANSLIAIADLSPVIGPSGTVDVPITLTESIPEGGINYIWASTLDSSGDTGRLGRLVVQLSQP